MLKLKCFVASITMIIFTLTAGCATTGNITSHTQQTHKNSLFDSKNNSSTSSINLKTIAIGVGIAVVAGLAIVALGNGVSKSFGQSLAPNIA